MPRYIVRRLLALIPVILGLTLVIFLLVNVIPGDTARLIAGEYADEATVEQIRTTMGLDKPILVQYGNYLLDLVQGDLGRSYQTHRPVLEEILTVFPKTIQLAVTTEVISIVVGLFLGMSAAVRRGSLFDRGITMFGVLGLSIPQFWFALILQLVLAVKFGWLPPSGYHPGHSVRRNDGPHFPISVFGGAASELYPHSACQRSAGKKRHLETCAEECVNPGAVACRYGYEPSVDRYNDRGERFFLAGNWKVWV